MAMLMRPPAGWLIDTRGTRPILLVGMAIFLLASLGYIATQSVQPILALRLFHGIGMGLFPTAATVVIAELAPPTRRGEAMGWFGITNSLGLIVGPVVGPAVAGRTWDFRRCSCWPRAWPDWASACICLVPACRATVQAVPTCRVRGISSAKPPSCRRSSCSSSTSPTGWWSPSSRWWPKPRGLENPGLFYTVFAVGHAAGAGQGGRDLRPDAGGRP